VRCESLDRSEPSDWCFGEVGLDYPRRADGSAPPRFLSPSTFAQLHAVSPSSHLQALSASTRLPPTLLLLGAADRRVPFSQGLNWFHALKGRGDDVRLLVFDDQGRASRTGTTTTDSHRPARLRAGSARVLPRAARAVRARDRFVARPARIVGRLIIAVAQSSRMYSSAVAHVKLVTKQRFL